MSIDQKKLKTRTTSAVLFIVVMLSAIIYNSWSFLALFAFVQFLCLREYIFLLEKIYQSPFSGRDKFSFLIAGFCAFLFLALLPIKTCAFSYHLFQNPLIFYFLGIFIGMMIILLLSKDKKARTLITGIGYIALPLALLHHLRVQSLLIPLFLIFSIWISDTGAYLGGSFFGKTPLAPSISPNKTREGTAIGILASLVFASLWSLEFTHYAFHHYIVLALIGSCLGTLGDLVESKIKRWAGVKDSGQMMPGHGGALDRFDSLIFSSSFAFIYALFFMDCQILEFF
jgi:phosphatidate cytidylyltransferase